MTSGIRVPPRRAFGLIACALVVVSAAASGQVEIGDQVIRTGDKILVVGPDPTLDLQTLIDDIVDASATNRYLIELGPGDYDLGANTLALKPFVDLRGSGQATTELVGDRSGSGSECGTDFGVIAMNDNSSLSDLTVTNNSSSSDPATALCNVTGSSPRVLRVTAKTVAVDGSGDRYAIQLVGGSPVLADISAISDGGDFANPLRCQDATVLVSRARLVAMNGLTQRGIGLIGTCLLEMRDLLLDLEGDVVNTGIVVQTGTEIDLSLARITLVGDTTNKGMSVIGGKAVLYDTRIQPKGGAVDNRGIDVSLAGVLRLFRSSVSGDPTALSHNATEDAFVSQSSLAGGVTVGINGTVTCVASDDGAGAERASDCSVPP